MGSTFARLFNDQQAGLEIFCLSCLWNFSETKEDRSLVLRKIGLEPFIHSLLKFDVPDVVDDNRIYDVIHANEASLGCLGGYEILNFFSVLLGYWAGLEINLDVIPVIMTGGSLNLPVTAEVSAGHCHLLASFFPCIPGTRFHVCAYTHVKVEIALYPTYEITKFIKGQHSVLCMI